MKKKKQLIAVLVAILATINMVNAQQKYALLIGGNHLPGTEIPNDHKWNGGLFMDPQKGYDEFWNDTYLMWEYLNTNEPVASNENIEVLFGNGNDYTFQFQHDRYNPLSNYGYTITDDAATKVHVLSELDDLVNINEEDFLYIWIMSNGGNEVLPGNINASFVYLWGYDPVLPNEGKLYDYEIKQKLDLIPAHKKVVIVQAPHSGYFASTLEDVSTTVITSSTASENASRANNTPYDENEEWDLAEYHHGEFGYHIFSSINKKDPGNNTSYGPTSFATADLNNDDVVSISEGLTWVNTYEDGPETSVLSDLGNKAPETSLKYPTVISNNVVSAKTVLGITNIPKLVHVNQGGSLTLKAVKVYINYYGELTVDAGGSLAIESNNTSSSHLLTEYTNPIEIYGDFSVGSGTSIESSVLSPIIINLKNSSVDLLLDNVSFNKVELTT